MEEQELYDELEFIKDEMKNGEIDVEAATKKLEEVLIQIEELIESKLDNLNGDYDQMDLYEDN
jgi:seryl-tRNA synthetase